jgi:hypothetical protein
MPLDAVHRGRFRKVEPFCPRGQAFPRQAVPPPSVPPRQGDPRSPLPLHADVETPASHITTTRPTGRALSTPRPFHPDGEAPASQPYHHQGDGVTPDPPHHPTGERRGARVTGGCASLRPHRRAPSPRLPFGRERRPPRETRPQPAAAHRVLQVSPSVKGAHYLSTSTSGPRPPIEPCKSPRHSRAASQPTRPTLNQRPTLQSLTAPARSPGSASAWRGRCRAPP